MNRQLWVYLLTEDRVEYKRWLRNTNYEQYADIPGGVMYTHYQNPTQPNKLPVDLMQLHNAKARDWRGSDVQNFICVQGQRRDGSQVYIVAYKKNEGGI